jgi:DHA1 family inner membrane transport protein
MYLPLVSLLLGAFAIGTTELVVAGLLPPIAADLGVSIPDAGLLVTGYALGVALGGPATMLVAGRFRRKPALLAVLGLFIAAHLACALAPSFAALMLGRVVAAAAHGCFFGLAIVLATASVRADRRATALSIVVGGINVANIVGVPLGTAVGNAFGWRAAFVMVAAFALVALLAIAAFVPDADREGRRAPLGRQIAVLLNATVLSAYGLIVLYMIAVFSLLTFIAPYLAETAGVGPERLPLILMGFGIAGAVGMFGGGRLTDRFPTACLAASFPLAAAALALAWLAMPQRPTLGIAALGLMSLVGSVATLAAQHRIVVAAVRAPELASTLMSSVFNVGIAAGAALGSGALAADLPVADVPLIGVLALVPASLVAGVAAYGDRN